MSFTKPTPNVENHSYVSVKFGKDKPLLETELNELQAIEDLKLKTVVSALLSDGVMGSEMRYTGTSFIMTGGKVILEGKLLDVDNLSLSASAGDSIYFLAKHLEVTYSSILKKYGYEPGSVTVSNDILDARVGGETSRRVQLVYRLSTSPLNGYTALHLGTITSNNTFNRIVKEVQLKNIISDNSKDNQKTWSSTKIDQLISGVKSELKSDVHNLELDNQGEFNWINSELRDVKTDVSVIKGNVVQDIEEIERQGGNTNLLSSLKNLFVERTEFTSNNSKNGYIQLPRGIILQWGTFSKSFDKSTSVQGQTSFPKSFGTAYMVNITPSSTMDAPYGNVCVAVGTIANTKFDWFANYLGDSSSTPSTQYFHWFAIGSAF